MNRNAYAIVVSDERSPSSTQQAIEQLLTGRGFRKPKTLKLDALLIASPGSASASQRATLLTVRSAFQRAEQWSIENPEGLVVVSYRGEGGEEASGENVTQYWVLSADPAENFSSGDLARHVARIDSSCEVVMMLESCYPIQPLTDERQDNPSETDEGFFARRTMEIRRAFENEFDAGLRRQEIGGRALPSIVVMQATKAGGTYVLGQWTRIICDKAIQQPDLTYTGLTACSHPGELLGDELHSYSKVAVENRVAFALDGGVGRTVGAVQPTRTQAQLRPGL